MANRINFAMIADMSIRYGHIATPTRICIFRNEFILPGRMFVLVSWEHCFSRHRKRLNNTYAGESLGGSWEAYLAHGLIMEVRVIGMSPWPRR